MPVSGPAYDALAVRPYDAAMSDVPALAEVLVAEDDRGVRESLVRALRFEGYEVRAVADGADALEAVAEREPDVVVLDVMMPYVDGLTACRELRSRTKELPILMLTARHEVHDRVAGLDAGADDYLVKPYAISELTARLRALLRRTSVSGSRRVPRASPTSRSIRAAARRRARGRQLELTKTEFDLLELLMYNAGIVLEPRHDLRADLGLRLRDLLAVARRLHRLPPPEDGGRR